MGKTNKAVVLESLSMNLIIIKRLLEQLGLYRYVRLRHRYFFTRSNRLRMRYAIVGGFFSLFLLVQLLGSVVSGSFALSLSDNDVASSVQTYDGVDEGNIMVLASLNEVDVQEEERDQASDLLAPLVQGDEGIYVDGLEQLGTQEKILKIDAGGTISGALQEAGVSGAEAYRVVKAMSEFYDPRTVKPGQAIAIKMESLDEGLSITHLDMKMSPTEALTVQKGENERFKAVLIKKEVVLKYKAAKSRIDSSLYASAARAGIPASLIAEMIHLYSYEVDFQRDIRKGDTMEVLYETYETEDGEFSHYGDLLFASLNVNKTDIPIYRYDREGMGADYFHEDGSSLKQLLMTTPVDGARMSSGYGMRKHPILGYSKMHKGMDFAAPRGTPIYAAGDGVVEKAGRNGSFGNYIRLRHNGSYKTAYAHMRNIANGVKSGKRVKQGQVIGYVGTTGRSTGPHLHYEVQKNGRQINPKSVKSTNREKLAGASLNGLKAQISRVKGQYASLAQDFEFAGN
jgi:murein DD-endopeptidase MepM/ murein hydrolase activator NlpD